MLSIQHTKMDNIKRAFSKVYLDLKKPTGKSWKKSSLMNYPIMRQC